MASQQPENPTPTNTAPLRVDGLTNSVLSREQFHRFRAGHVSAINYTAVHYARGLEEVMPELGAFLGRMQELSDCYAIAKTTDDILRAHREGKVAIILGMQNGKPLGDRPDLFPYSKRWVSASFSLPTTSATSSATVVWKRATPD
jgi:microsomal dipeptidase-like Zn-dependent dipeptidase